MKKYKVVIGYLYGAEITVSGEYKSRKDFLKVLNAVLMETGNLEKFMPKTDKIKVIPN